MNRSTSTIRFRPQAGFSLIEVLVVMLLLSVIVLIGLPALQGLVLRNKLEGFARNIAIDLQAARQAAIQSGSPVVVRFDENRQQIVAFVDVPPAGQGPDYRFAPVPGAAHRTTDWEIGRWSLPSANSEQASIRFAVPDGAIPLVEGFTTVDDEPVAVFLPNGSIESSGSFHFGDFREPGNPQADKCGNCFRVSIEPEATARVQILKYHYEDGEFYPQGRRGNKALWKWY